MLSKHRIVLRKRIKDHQMIKEFESLSRIKLPNPPLELPIEEHLQVLKWEMDMTKDSTVQEYKKLLSLFELPFKTDGADRLHFVIKRYCWWDILFEVYKIEQ